METNPNPESTTSSADEKLNKSEYEDKYGRYLHMLKMGVPRAAVELKLRMVGLNPAGLDGPLSPKNEDCPAALPSDTLTISKSLSPSKMVLPGVQSTMRKKIHWSTRSRSTIVESKGTKESFWENIHRKAQAGRVWGSIESKKWVDKLFVKAVKASEMASKFGVIATRSCQSLDCGSNSAAVRETNSAKRFLARKPSITLLDGKKSQNVAIILARVKKSHKDLVRELVMMSTLALPSPALQSIIDMWPDNAELEAINCYQGDIKSLASAEQFFMEALKIPRMKQKLHCLLQKMEFRSRVHELRENIHVLVRGIHQVRSSRRLGDVLGYIFHMGNYLNFGEDMENATSVQAFSITSLDKLSDTKAYEGGISFLQYIVDAIERDEPHLALFYDDISLISKCSKVSLQSLISEQKDLEFGLEMLIDEIRQSAPFDIAGEKNREQLELAHSVMKQYAIEVQQELCGVQDLMNTLEESKQRFFAYFEEDENISLDQLLGSLARFVEEYQKERDRRVFRACPSSTNTKN